VATLPTTDIKTNVIYLKWPIGTWADKYEEWIYYSNTWTKIWETSVDLSPYLNLNTQNSDVITEWSTKLFLTAWERTKLWNTSWTNTWDETTASIKTKLWAATSSADWYLTKEDFATFNWKQNALSTQTAYTSKWSATKVPQITTNSLGQVTEITEVSITYPNQVSDTAYASSWDWVTWTAPSKNAVYDKISSMDTTISGKQNTISDLSTIRTNATNWATVVSGDTWVTYTIKVSNSDPASWTASNIITLVP
jgi:hypothetical protein